MSLAQGVVHWPPPPSVSAALATAASEPDTCQYGADDGRADLREALMEKLRAENGLEGVDVMVTAGANQAYTNIVVALLDADDRSVLFAPYYFNHLMALQMTGGGPEVLIAPAQGDFMPDASWLADQFREAATSGGPRIRMVTVVNPCNPSGVAVPADLLRRIGALCAEHGAWLVVDNTYENFMYEEDGGRGHACISGDHIVNVFSFSKAYGMMGFRVGYLAYPPVLRDELMKVQDTIAICPSIVSQKAALAALGAGPSWVNERVKSLAENKRLMQDSVRAALGPDSVIGGSGAIYLMVRLPADCFDDFRVVEWLSDRHKVCAIPGSACGAPGTIRLCYASLKDEPCREAIRRLCCGFKELVEHGAGVMADSAL